MGIFKKLADAVERVVVGRSERDVQSVEDATRKAAEDRKRGAS